MPASTLPLGWLTDFILPRFDAEVTDHGDCIAIRTEQNPSFYWGNCLLLPQAPADADLAHWRARFSQLIAAGQPEVQHVAIGVRGPREPNDANHPTGVAGPPSPASAQWLPAWQADGFQIQDTAVLALQRGEPLAPARPVRARSWALRHIDWATELPAFIDLQCLDCAPYAPAGYRRFRQQQMARIARLAVAGQAAWFGGWCDGVLAADCGLIRDAATPGALGRFQMVGTHPGYRRRGLCTALVRGVSAWGFEHWQLAQAVLCADPHDVAIGIYQALGYRPVDAAWQLQRNAAVDQAPTAAVPLPTPAPDALPDDGAGPTATPRELPR